MVASAAFAAAFYLLSLAAPEALAGDAPAGMALLEVCLWYSAVNLVTTGYGALVPATRAAYALSTAEQFVGLLLSALLLGVVVTKASIPSAKLVFSKVMVMSRRDGRWVLTCRIGNARGNFLYNPEIRLAYLFPALTKEGERLWDEERLEVADSAALKPEERLEVADSAALKPVFYICHTVTRASPLWGKCRSDLLAERGLLALTVVATDDQTLQTLYARMIYRVADIRWEHRFEEVLVEEPASGGSGRQLCIDFHRFHLTTPLPRTPGSSCGEADSEGESEAGAVDLPPVHPGMGQAELQQLLGALGRMCMQAAGEAPGAPPTPEPAQGLASCMPSAGGGGGGGPVLQPRACETMSIQDAQALPAAAECSASVCKGRSPKPAKCAARPGAPHCARPGGASEGAAPARQRTPLAQLKNLRIGGAAPAGVQQQAAKPAGASSDPTRRARALELGARTFQDFKERRQRQRRTTGQAAGTPHAAPHARIRVGDGTDSPPSVTSREGLGFEGRDAALTPRAAAAGADLDAAPLTLAFEHQAMIDERAELKVELRTISARLAVLEARSQGWARAPPPSVKGRSRSAPRGGPPLRRRPAQAPTLAPIPDVPPPAQAEALRGGGVAQLGGSGGPRGTGAEGGDRHVGRQRQRGAGRRAARAQSTDSRASDASAGGHWAPGKQGAWEAAFAARHTTDGKENTRPGARLARARETAARLGIHLDFTAARPGLAHSAPQTGAPPAPLVASTTPAALAARRWQR
ncbi:hypothetical protein WJX81_005310 [Elliptochloris bilobata]|uniref:Potassium channel domain-containing protein n=1 Tax=Elliptochloris bilobata TaxID=381761 RepID=A0AAW1RS45_9CHLO